MESHNLIRKSAELQMEKMQRRQENVFMGYMGGLLYYNLEADCGSAKYETIRRHHLEKV